MAHTCPECGMQCHCKGDIDDIDLGRQPKGGCVHYLRLTCDGHDDGEYEDDFYDDYDDNDHPLNPSNEQSKAQPK